jgi:death-on-curing protein
VTVEPRFLDLDEVLEIHEDQLARHGGSAGLRDAGLLESALAMPRASFGGQYAHPDVFEMAAAYLFHLAKNHPFVDGKKRVALAAALVFLRLNGWALPGGDPVYEITLRVASGSAGKGDAAAYFRARARPSGGRGSRRRRG